MGWSTRAAELGICCLEVSGLGLAKPGSEGTVYLCLDDHSQTHCRPSQVRRTSSPILAGDSRRRRFQDRPGRATRKRRGSRKSLTLAPRRRIVSIGMMLHFRSRRSRGCAAKLRHLEIAAAIARSFEVDALYLPHVHCNTAPCRASRASSHVRTPRLMRGRQESAGLNGQR